MLSRIVATFLGWVLPQWSWICTETDAAVFRLDRPRFVVHSELI